MRNYFDELLLQLAKHEVAVNMPYLHGLLTGCATVPDLALEKLLLEFAPTKPLAESLRGVTIDAVGELSKSLSDSTFQTRLENQETDARHWIDGYLKAVHLHDAQWEEQSDLSPEAGVTLIMLHALNDDELRRDMNMDLPGPADLQGHPELLTNLVLSIYHEFHGGADDDFEMLDDDYSASLLCLLDEELEDMDEEELFAFVVACDDELNLEVVHECARRGEAMVPLLRQHLEDAANWTDSIDESDWWALLHAVHILGLIPGEASADALLGAFRRINFEEYNDLSDWLSTHWPALCQNKTEFTSTPLRQIAEDHTIRWYARCQATNCVVAAAAESGSAELEQAIDWLAARCGDESEDRDFRVIAGHTLIDFPRERHLTIMEGLVALQEPLSPVENSYTVAEIQHAFDTGDDPEWQRFSNPWKFYDPDEIRRRQARWLAEAEDFDSDLYGNDRGAPLRTYVRDQAKIGRNEPCPCGSGRKYKKCCMDETR